MSKPWREQIVDEELAHDRLIEDLQTIAQNMGITLQQASRLMAAAVDDGYIKVTQSGLELTGSGRVYVFLGKDEDES